MEPVRPVITRLATLVSAALTAACVLAGVACAETLSNDRSNARVGPAASSRPPVPLQSGSRTSDVSRPPAPLQSGSRTSEVSRPPASLQFLPRASDIGGSSMSPAFLRSLDPRPVTVSFLRRMGSNYAAQLAFPFSYARGHPVRSLLFIGGIGALLAADEPFLNVVSPQDELAENGLIRQSRAVSNGSQRVAPFLFLGVGSIGLLANSPRERETTSMLAEAYLTSATWVNLIKVVAGRDRPFQFHGAELAGDGRAQDPVLGHTYRSFPSGHTATAFSLATVFAHRYPQRRVVPVLAYGTAAAVGYSRVGLRAHWLSDVVVGALIGYGSARQVIGAHRNDTARSQALARSGPHLKLDLSGGRKALVLGVDF